MLNIILALVMPIVMMLFFTRVSYSKYGALIVTLMILFFAFDGLQQAIPVIVIGSLSTVVGFFTSFRIQKKNRGV